jgi:hypothetical protein
MYDLRSLELLHRHSDDEWHPMREVHDSAATDPERSWLHGGRIFKCSQCESEVLVRMPNGETAEETSGG